MFEDVGSGAAARAKESNATLLTLGLACPEPAPKRYDVLRFLRLPGRSILAPGGKSRRAVGKVLPCGEPRAMQVAGLANVQEPPGTVSDKGSSQQGERVIRPSANGILHPSILRLFCYGLSAHTRILNQS